MKEFEATLEQHSVSQLSLDILPEQSRQLDVGDAAAMTQQHTASSSLPAQPSINSHEQLQQQPLLAAPETPATLPGPAKDPPAEEGHHDYSISKSEGCSSSSAQPFAELSLNSGTSNVPSLPEHEQDQQAVACKALPAASPGLHRSGQSSSHSSRASIAHLPVSTKRMKAISSKGSGVAAAIGPLLQAMQGLLAVTGVALMLNPLLEAQVAPFMRQARNAGQSAHDQAAQQQRIRCA